MTCSICDKKIKSNNKLWECQKCGIKIHFKCFADSVIHGNTTCPECLYEFSDIELREMVENVNFNKFIKLEGKSVFQKYIIDFYINPIIEKNTILLIIHNLYGLNFELRKYLITYYENLFFPTKNNSESDTFNFESLTYTCSYMNNIYEIIGNIKEIIKPPNNDYYFGKCDECGESVYKILNYSLIVKTLKTIMEENKYVNEIQKIEDLPNFIDDETYRIYQCSNCLKKFEKNQTDHLLKNKLCKCGLPLNEYNKCLYCRFMNKNDYLNSKTILDKYVKDKNLLNFSDSINYICKLKNNLNNFVCGFERLKNDEWWQKKIHFSIHPNYVCPIIQILKRLLKIVKDKNLLNCYFNTYYEKIVYHISSKTKIDEFLEINKSFTMDFHLSSKFNKLIWEVIIISVSMLDELKSSQDEFKKIKYSILDLLANKFSLSNEELYQLTNDFQLLNQKINNDFQSFAELFSKIFNLLIEKINFYIPSFKKYNLLNNYLEFNKWVSELYTLYRRNEDLIINESLEKIIY